MRSSSMGILVFVFGVALAAPARAWPVPWETVVRDFRGWYQYNSQTFHKPWIKITPDATMGVVVNERTVAGVIPEWSAMFHVVCPYYQREGQILDLPCGCDYEKVHGRWSLQTCECSETEAREIAHGAERTVPEFVALPPSKAGGPPPPSSDTVAAALESRARELFPGWTEWPHKIKFELLKLGPPSYQPYEEHGYKTPRYWIPFHAIINDGESKDRFGRLYTTPKDCRLAVSVVQTAPHAWHIDLFTVNPLASSGDETVRSGTCDKLPDRPVGAQ